jgi:hypothetical protein
MRLDGERKSKMAVLVYSLCALTAMLCSGLLLRSFSKSKFRLLLWSGLCFAGLSLNNLILIVDRIFYPGIDLSQGRLLIALVAMLPLLYGLIWDDE